MKTRRGFRRITLPSGNWQYKIGKSNVVAYSEDGLRFQAEHDVILGINWGDIERYRWKNRGSDHRANMTPAEIADWIESTSKMIWWLREFCKVAKK